MQCIRQAGIVEALVEAISKFGDPKINQNTKALKGKGANKRQSTNDEINPYTRLEGSYPPAGSPLSYTQS